MNPFEYSEDGEDEAVQFFRDNSNSDSLISEMDENELWHFYAWTDGRMMDGQQWWGFDKMTSQEQNRTMTYDKYLDRATLAKGITVYRLGSAKLLGLSDTAQDIQDLRALEGRIIPAKGNMSFSAASEGLPVLGRKNVEYELKVPPSTGAGMWIGDERLGFHGPKQREFMMNRDVNYKVGKSRYDSARDVYVVQLEYVGRNKHDYGKRGT